MPATTNSPSAANARARPLSLEERQASIVDAVIPLLATHGRDISSKQIAEASGVAEGTVFRAFGDKDSIINAAIEKLLDPDQLGREIRAIEPSLGVEDKVEAVIGLLKQRYGDVFRVMAIIGHDRHAHPESRTVVADAISDLLANDKDRLRWTLTRCAHLIRLVTFASAFPHVTEGEDLTTADLAAFVLHGICSPTSRTLPATGEKPAERLN